MSPDIGGDDHRPGCPKKEGLLSGASRRVAEAQKTAQLLLPSNRLAIFFYFWVSETWIKKKQGRILPLDLHKEIPNLREYPFLKAIDADL